VPQGPEDVAMAEQATDYILHIISNDNPGVSVFYSALKDSLYNKAGIVKWWKDDSFEVTHHTFSGLNDVALGLILEEPGVELVEWTGTGGESAAEELVGPVAMQGLGPPLVHSGRVRRPVRGQKLRIAAVAPEQCQVDRNARDIDPATYVGHR